MQQSLYHQDQLQLHTLRVKESLVHARMPSGDREMRSVNRTQITRVVSHNHSALGLVSTESVLRASVIATRAGKVSTARLLKLVSLMVEE
jgi:hypothetical protein